MDSTHQLLSPLSGKHPWPAMLPMLECRATVSGSISEFLHASQDPVPHHVHIWQMAHLLWAAALVQSHCSRAGHPTSQRNIPSASLSLTGASPGLWNRGESRRTEVLIPGLSSKAVSSVSRMGEMPALGPALYLASVGKAGGKSMS